MTPNSGVALERPGAGANLFGWDYRRKAAELGNPPVPISDSHIHVNGATTARIYREVMDLFGVRRILSQTALSEADAVREALGDRVSFMGVWNWRDPDKARAFREGYLEHIALWHERHGARSIKLWGAPRLWEVVGGDPTDIVPLDAPWRVRHAELAVSLGMMIMTHVADPDTWFKTRYADAARYRTKRDYYASLERMLERFNTVPWIAAHMGGWPEDLGFLDGLLTRHAHLVLDTSATKWMVRELCGHPTARAREFFLRWQDRLLFGSDIVALEEHAHPPPPGTPPASPMSDLARSPAEAFDLYASRYWALRTMFETSFSGPSPIADPDLMMVEPEKHGPKSSPELRGMSLPRAVLEKLYHANADRVVWGWIRDHGGR